MTLDQALADIERIRQFKDDLYKAKDEEGNMRALLQCEYGFLNAHREINRSWDHHIADAKRRYGSELTYACIFEAARKKQAVELQAALDHMKALREDERV